MFKKIFIVSLCVAVAVLTITGCGTQNGEAGGTPSATEAESTQPAAETEVTQIEVAENELAAVTLNGAEFILPVAYHKFADAIGYTFETALEDTSCPVIAADTKIPAFTTFAQMYSIGDSGYLTLLYANMTSAEQNAEDCQLIGVKAMRFHKEDCDLDLKYMGTDWDSSADEVVAALGEAGNEEKEGKYTMLGYSVANGDFVNISYSFVLDEDNMYSFALSIDFLEIVLDSMQAETAEAEE